MAAYKAGKVIEFGSRLVDADDAAISRCFLVPDADTVRAGLIEAGDPEESIAAAEGGRLRLGEMVRSTAAFYRKYEEVHIQYKHGLRLPLRPFGDPTEETIAERKTNVEASVYSYTNESIAQVLWRPVEEQMMAFAPGPTQQGDLKKLVEERNILRLRLAADIDLDEVAERAYRVMRLLAIGQRNRLAVGNVEEDGGQRFCLSGRRSGSTSTCSSGSTGPSR
jgi:hypothetical protein